VIDSAYCLDTWIGGIDGSSSHIVSIPLMEAIISTASIGAHNGAGQATAMPDGLDVERT
jgi:hypothetical protein